MTKKCIIKVLNVCMYVCMYVCILSNVIYLVDKYYCLTLEITWTNVDAKRYSVNIRWKYFDAKMLFILSILTMLFLPRK